MSGMCKVKFFMTVFSTIGSSISRIFNNSSSNIYYVNKPHLINGLERDVVELSKKCPISAKNIIDEVGKCGRFIDYCKNESRKFVSSMRYADARIVESLNPETLPIISSYPKTLHISNFNYPHGTIAIPGKLNEAISTNGLLQCAAVSIVDKEKNLQTLIHCCPGEQAQVNRTILDYILSVSKNSNPEITIVPGCYTSTNKTISFLVDNIEDIMGKDFKIKFANFPDEEKTSLILNNGKLTCSERFYIEKVNPDDRIVHCSSYYNEHMSELDDAFL